MLSEHKVIQVVGVACIIMSKLWALKPNGVFNLAVFDSIPSFLICGNMTWCGCVFKCCNVHKCSSPPEWFDTIVYCLREGTSSSSRTYDSSKSKCQHSNTC